MKNKNHPAERLPASQFILLTGLISLLASLTFLVMNASAIYRLLNYSMMLYVIVSFSPAIVIVAGQTALFKYQFGWSVRRWLIAGFAGIFLMIVWNFTYSILLAYIPPTRINAWLLQRVPVFIMAIAQYLALRPYVNRAWLWIIAMTGLSVISYPLFSLLHQSSLINSGIFISSFLAGVQGIVIGIVLTWLVRMTLRDEQKRVAGGSSGDAVSHNLGQ